MLRYYMILHTFFAKVISEDEEFEQRVGITNGGGGGGGGGGLI